MTNRWLKKCSCGYGQGWYCNGDHEMKHEFNPNVSIDVATMPHQADRRPVGEVFCQILGACVVAIFNDSENTISKNFYYRKYKNRSSAFRAGIEWVVSMQKNSLFGN